MTQMVQQISVEQTAVPVQTGQSTAKAAAQNTDVFQSLVQSAAETASKKPEKADAGEKTGKEKTGEGENRSLDGTDLGLMQMQGCFQPVILPIDTTELNVPEQISAADDAPADLTATSGTVPISGTPEKVSLETAADSPAVQDVRALPDDSVSNSAAQTVSPAVKADPSAPTDSHGQVISASESPTVTQSESPAVSDPFITDTAVREKPLEARVPAKSEVEESTVSDTEAVPADHAAAAEADQTETQAAIQTEAPKAEISMESPQAEKPELRISDENAQPQKKTEISEKDGQAQSLADLYSGGNVVVKVSDAEAAQKTTAASQVAQAVAQQAKRGKQEIQVELYPQSLGKVSVKLSSENGVLTVEIAASNPKTQSMLLSGSDDIRSMLQSSTGQNVSVVKAQPQQSNGWYAWQDGGGSGGSGYQRQDQEDEQDESGVWRRAVQSVGTGMNTGSFLSLLRQIAQ